MTSSTLSPTVFQRFLQLSAALSPENLSADGERSPREVPARRRMLERSWKDLEREVGRSVTEDEVWAGAGEASQCAGRTDHSNPKQRNS